MSLNLLIVRMPKANDNREGKRELKCVDLVDYISKAIYLRSVMMATTIMIMMLILMTCAIAAITTFREYKRYLYTQYYGGYFSDLSC